MEQQNTRTDAAAAWIAVQAVVNRLVERELMTREEADALLKGAAEQGREKVSEEMRPRPGEYIF